MNTNIIHKWNLKVSENGTTFYFTWTGSEPIDIIAEINDGYTGLNYYSVNILANPGIINFVENTFTTGKNSAILSKYFTLSLKEGLEPFLIVHNDEGVCDISEFDELGLLYKYNSFKDELKDCKGVALPLYEIFITSIYEHEKKCFVKPNDIVVDIGANIGFFTIQALQKKCKFCYSFEPLETECKIFKEVIKDIENVKVYNKAVSDFTGKSNFFEHTMVNLPIEELDTFEVDVISFMDFVHKEDLDYIDFLKLDVEGSEWSIFSSIPDEYLQKINRIALEFHNNTYQLKELLNRLENLGFEYNCPVGHDMSDTVESPMGMIYIWQKTS